MRRRVLGWLGAGIAANLGLALLAACKLLKGTGGSTSTGGSPTSTTSSSTSSSGTGGGSSTSSTSSSSSGSSTSSTSSSSGTDAGSSSSSTSSSTGSVMTGDSVLTHHKNPSRDGLYVQPTFTKAAIGTLHRDTSFNTVLPAVDGGGQDIYAQPLFVDGMGGQDLVIVATEDNNVYALDAATGNTVWTKNLGPPVWSTPPLPCGDIFPSGITGTPVIDLGSRTIFVDALVLLSSTTYHHQIFALSVDTGAVQSGWPVDVDTAAKSGATSFVSTAQGQLGALALVDGTLYVPFGGLFGSCPTYYGWVVAVPIADPASVSAWATTYTGAGVGAPGGISSDGTSLFVSTDGSFPPSGSSRPRGAAGTPSSSLAPVSAGDERLLRPANWYQLGQKAKAWAPRRSPSTSPDRRRAPWPSSSERTATPTSWIAHNPGGVGAALGAERRGLHGHQQHQRLRHGPRVQLRGDLGAGALHHGVSDLCRRLWGSARGRGGVGDLFAVAIQPGSPPTVAKAWCSLQNGSGAPMVTTSDGHSDAIVWSVGVGGDSLLHAFDGDTGAAISFADDHLGLVNVAPDSSPIAAKGRIFVAVRGGVFAFALLTGNRGPPAERHRGLP